MKTESITRKNTSFEKKNGVLTVIDTWENETHVSSVVEFQSYQR